MQMYPEKFHRHRLHDPFRQAERSVFQSLAHSRAPGFAHYEWQRSWRNRPALQLDYAIWLQNVVRFGLQVKGGRYKLEKGVWRRRKGRRGGYERVTTCPVAITANATMSLLKEVAEALDQSTFFIPVLVFPDMDPDDAIISKVQSSNVHLVWGADRLVERLAEIAREVGVYRPPDAHDIGKEVKVITDGQIKYGCQQDTGSGAYDSGEPYSLVNDFAAPNLVFHHVRRVQVSLAPGHGNG